MDTMIIITAVSAVMLCGAAATPAAPLAAYNLAVNAAPSAGGTVTRSPKQQNYVSGTPVTLTAAAASALGYRFAGWSGVPKGVDSTKSSITFNITEHATITANFKRTYTLTVDAAPSRGGRTLRAPDFSRYDAGAQVTLKAIPEAGYQFSGWTRGAEHGFVSKDSVFINKMNNNLSLTANFAKIKIVKEKKKASPLMLTMRWSTAALAVGGFIGGAVYGSAADSEQKKYDNAQTYAETAARRKEVEDNISARNVFYTIGAIGASAFTLTLFF